MHEEIIKQFRQTFTQYIPVLVQKDIDNFLTQALQKVREDTVKEVLDILEKTIQEERWSGAPHAIEKAKQNLTNLITPKP